LRGLPALLASRHHWHRRRQPPDTDGPRHGRRQRGGRAGRADQETGHRRNRAAAAGRRFLGGPTRWGHGLTDIARARHVIRCHETRQTVHVLVTSYDATRIKK
jgi:hypothetical protein